MDKLMRRISRGSAQRIVAIFMTLSLILQLLPAQSVAYATEAFVSDETGQLLDSGDIQGDAAVDVAIAAAGL